MIALLRINALLLTMFLSSIALAQDRCAIATKDVKSACEPGKLIQGNLECEVALNSCLEDCKKNQVATESCRKQKSQIAFNQGEANNKGLIAGSRNENVESKGLTVTPLSPKLPHSLAQPHGYDEFIKQKQQEEGLGIGVQVKIPLGR